MSAMEKAISGVVLLWCLGAPALTAARSAEGPENGGDAGLESKLAKIQREIQGDRKEAAHQSSRMGIAASSPAAGGSLFKAGIQMAVCLAFILVLVVLSIKLLKRFQKAAFLKTRGAGRNSLEVLETCYLGKDQKVVHMRMDNSRVFLGVTSHGIQTLEMPERVTPIHSPASRPSDNTPNDFSKNLNQLLTKFKKPKTVTQSLAEM
jgi:flagellar biogenesis protein FliO